jgi:predicted metal-dependent HD superfamily phosphohydrolase
MNYVQMLEQVKDAAQLFFQTHEKPPLVYHNLAHTEQVVAQAAQIARHYQLNDYDFFIVASAAWFHDTGYYITDGENHEEAGAELLTDFLKSRNVDEVTINAIRGCIMATKMPQLPNNLLEQIICDADLFHLGTDSFSDTNKMMRKEVSSRKGVKVSKAEWRAGTIAFLSAHHFKTDYGRNLLEPVKQQNLAALKAKALEEKLEEVESNNQGAPTVAPADTSIVAVDAPESNKKKKKNDDRPDRGIETMFRISSGNHQRLSDMADNKAHIMITTTSIILSVLLSVLLRKLEDNPHLVIPTMMLLLVCVTTMVFCILATRPNLPYGTFTQEDIDEKKVNLLFFGNFYRMNFQEYNAGMLKMMNDRDFLYGSLIRDLYSQGKVLGRKYRLLRVGYNVFMFGIIASVLAFILAVTVIGE